jgi:hypothetical protein
MNQDAEHLRLLTIFHYVLAALVALVACFPIIHLLVGIGLAGGAMASHGDGAVPGAFVGVFFAAVALFMILVGWAVAVAMALTGRNLAKRQGYIFCLVVAAVECTFMPIGTALGVFTIIVLLRPSVKVLFEQPIDVLPQ